MHTGVQPSSMARIRDFHQGHLEWEQLDSSQQITQLTFTTGLYKLNSDCTINFSRNSQYRLKATISGVIDHPDDIDPDIEKYKGMFLPKENVTAFSKSGMYKYTFFNVSIGAMSATLISANSSSLNFEAEFDFSSVERTFNRTTEKVAIIQEWFLTGRTSVNFVRSTTRKVDRVFKRLRDGIDPEEDFNLVQSSGGSRDFLHVKLAGTSFIVAKVPDEFGPEWSYNIAIEYRQSFGGIPTADEREAISEFVAFIFGNQLLKIGETHYDASSSVIIEKHQQPWGDNVVSKCKRQGSPPVNIQKYDDWNKSERLLNEHTARYLELRKKLSLKDSLWKYWIARYSSIGTNLPILSSAVETLAGAILKSHPEVKSYYIEPKIFVEMINEELALIKAKLKEYPNFEIIMNKLRGASQRGSNEKLQMMFEILELPIGLVERRAIKARNKMAHSSLGDIEDDEIMEIVRMTRAYETLFNRILLKLVSYEGDYIDYYSKGHPDRNINEAIPE